MGQALDDQQASSQEFNPENVNYNKVDEIMPSTKKSPPRTNENGIRNSINSEFSCHERSPPRTNEDGIRNSIDSEFLCHESSMDLPALDSPDSLLETDSEEQLTDDESEPVPPLCQSLGAVAERTKNNSKFYTQFAVKSSNAPLRRRALHDNERIHQGKDNDFTISKGRDKITEIVEKIKDVFISKKLLHSMAGLLLILCALYLFSLHLNTTSPKNIHFYINEEILNQYPSLNRLELNSMIRAISSVNQGERESDKVAVITMLYSHRETAECLARKMANYAVKVINRNKDFVQLNGSLNNEEFHLGNRNLRKDVEGKGVLVVYDFHNFPPEKVRYFHAIFDKHTPYIDDKAVYIILLKMSKNQEGIPKKFEKLLSRIEELWSILKSEILNPLGTRLMDNVVVVHQEQTLLC